jgi:hypothetical protein
MKKSLRELYQSAVIVKDPSLDGKINTIKRSPEHEAMHDKLVAILSRMKAKQEVEMTTS